ncbi:MAG: hypothetical protein LBO03_04030 [Acidaminococcales bacterium]|nr:hypothetical protein [Acidaminococcales bacterium]
MNIQNVSRPVNNIVPANSGGAEETNAPVSPEGAEQALPAPAAGRDAAILSPGQDAIDALLKELAEKLSFSEKVINGMPESLKNDIKNLLAQKATLFDLGKGLVNLVQGQKDIFNNLNKLAGELSRLAQFMAEAAPEGAAETARHPRAGNDYIPFSRDAVLAKLDLQHFRQLLASIAGGKDVVRAGKDGSEAAPPKPENAPASPQKAVLAPSPKQPPPILINRQAIEAASGQKQTSGKVAEAPARPAGAEKTGAAADEPAARSDSAADGQTVKGRPGQKADLSSFFRNMTAVRGLADTDGVKALANLANAIKGTVNKTAKQPEQERDATVGQKGAPAGEVTRQPSRGGSWPSGVLLAKAKEALPELPGQSFTAKAESIANLFQNLAALKKSLDGMAGADPRLARALKALNGDPAVFSLDEKVLLTDVFERLVKEHFRDRAGLDVLERALNRLTAKEQMPLDKETAGLQVFARLLKYADSLQYPRRQVQAWANALRDLADNMVKTIAGQGDKSSQHIQGSFVFNLASEGQEKHTPVYIDVYREKNGGREFAGKSGETWLRIKVSPEYVGQVTAIFHLYQESLLDVKIVFANQDGMEEFSRFLPDIEDALRNTNMQVNSIVVA